MAGPRPLQSRTYVGDDLAVHRRKQALCVDTGQDEQA
jgi:hypothetical protein